MRFMQSIWNCTSAGVWCIVLQASEVLGVCICSQEVFQWAVKSHAHPQHNSFQLVFCRLRQCVYEEWKRCRSYMQGMCTLFCRAAWHEGLQKGDAKWGGWGKPCYCLLLDCDSQLLLITLMWLCTCFVCDILVHVFKYGESSRTCPWPP